MEGCVWRELPPWGPVATSFHWRQNPALFCLLLNEPDTQVGGAVCKVTAILATPGKQGAVCIGGSLGDLGGSSWALHAGGMLVCFGDIS